jgi:phytoene synthase
MNPVDLKLCSKYSRELIRIHSKSFYFSSLLLPSQSRSDVHALYGFCRYADNLVDKPRNRSPREIESEVRALEAELKVAYKTGESEHPVICSFIQTAQKHEIPQDYPLELLEGVLMDNEPVRYPTFNDLYLFCYRVAGVVGVMMTYILGYQSPDAFGYAVKLGVAMQLTNILRDVHEDIQRDRLYFPLDELQQFQVEESEIKQGVFLDRLKKLMQFSADRAHRYYEEARPGISLLSRKCQFAIEAASRIYGGILEQIRAHDYDPFRGRVFVPDVQKLLLILSAYAGIQLRKSH